MTQDKGGATSNILPYEIRWTDIEAECGSYRDGYVTVFRKYEGQPTDERDAQGRVVTVTMSSFARHVGIPESTFKEWVVRPSRVVTPEHRERMESARARKGLAELSPEGRAEVVRQAVAENPEVRKALVEDPETYEQISQARIEHIVERADRGEPGISREEYGRGMRQAYEDSALLQLSKVQERLAALQVRFKPEDFAEELSGDRDIKSLENSLSRDIDYLEAIREAVRSSRKPRLVSKSS